jgi:hypothetical protein
MPSRTIASTSRAHFVISCGAIFNISHPHLSMFFAAVEALSPSVYGARIGRVSADFRQLGQVLAAAKGPRPPDRHSSLGSPACFLSDISGWRGGGLYPLASRASGRIRRLAPAIGDGRRVCDGDSVAERLATTCRDGRPRREYELPPKLTPRGTRSRTRLPARAGRCA